MTDTNVNFEVEIHVAQRAEHLYAATIMPFNLTGLSDTFDGAIDRAKKGLGHLLEAYEADGNLAQFLDEIGVEYSLTPESAAVDSSVRRERERLTYGPFDSLREVNEYHAEH